MRDSKKRTYSPLALVVLLVYVAPFLHNVFSSANGLLHPFPTDFSEPLPYYMSIQTLYKDFNSYPYLITYNPPLYYALFDLLRPLFASSPLVFYERLLNCVAAAASLTLLYLLCRRALGQSRFSSGLAVLLFSGSFMLDTNLLNIPLFELCLDLLAVMALLSKREKGHLYAALISAIAFFTRQSSAAVILGIVAYLVSQGEKRKALEFSLIFLSIALPAVLALNMATGGRYVFSVFLLPLMTPLTSFELVPLLLAFLALTPVVALLIVYLHGALTKKKSPLLWPIIFLLLSLISLAKWGAYYPYLVVPFAFLCAGAAPYAESLLNSDRMLKSGKPVDYLLPILLFYLFLVPAYLYTSGRFLTEIGPPAAMSSALRNFTGNVLVDNPVVAFDANKSLQFEPSVFWVMQQKGLWNDSRLVSDVMARRFSAIVYTPAYSCFHAYNGLTDAINASYTTRLAVGDWHLAVPRT